MASFICVHSAGTLAQESHPSICQIHYDWREATPNNFNLSYLHVLSSNFSQISDYFLIYCVRGLILRLQWSLNVDLMPF